MKNTKTATPPIVQDVKSGALPLAEIPGYVVFMIRKSFWFWFVIIVAGVVLMSVK